MINFNFIYFFFFFFTDPEIFKALFSQTTRGRDQLVFCGQPFIYEKCIVLASGELKKLWRCNQWWNKRCRARVYTVNEIVTPLNKYHTHEDIIRRKKRVSRKPKELTATTTTTTTTAAATNEEQVVLFIASSPKDPFSISE